VPTLVFVIFRDLHHPNRSRGLGDSNVFQRTWWQALLQLLSLVGVLQGESVEVFRASDLELDLVVLLVLLDARGCRKGIWVLAKCHVINCHPQFANLAP
jgi:hypothetical protein